MKIIKLQLKQESREMFLKSNSNREMFDEFGEIFEVYFSDEKNDYRTVKYKTNRMGWYLTEKEIKTHFDKISETVEFKKPVESSIKLVLEKTVLINDMRVTTSNMEEFFENIRKMLS